MHVLYGEYLCCKMRYGSKNPLKRLTTATSDKITNQPKEEENKQRHLLMPAHRTPHLKLMYKIIYVFKSIYLIFKGNCEGNSKTELHLTIFFAKN